MRPMLQKPPCRQTAGWFSAARPVAVRCLSLARRYNTLDFAIPVIKRRSRSLATLGDCKQSLSLVRQAGPHAKSCANRDATRPYWMTQRGLRPIKATPHQQLALSHQTLRIGITCDRIGFSSSSQKPKVLFLNWRSHRGTFLAITEILVTPSLYSLTTKGISALRSRDLHLAIFRSFLKLNTTAPSAVYFPSACVMMRTRSHAGFAQPR